MHPFLLKLSFHGSISILQSGIPIVLNGEKTFKFVLNLAVRMKEDRYVSQELKRYQKLRNLKSLAKEAR